MKIHNNFHTSLIQKIVIDSFTRQIQSSSLSVIVEEKKEYEVNDVLNSLYYYDKLQYKIV
jgi:hypothetical protein